jgi:hypothetical protein
MLGGREAIGPRERLVSLSRGHVIRSVPLLNKTDILHTLCKNFLANHQRDVD